MLMIPTMHRISGQRHPGVLHVAARTLGTHAFSIFGDHSDVMSCRNTGFGMLASGSVQEVMDLAGIAHLAAIKGRVPFMHFFDGFRTSHEIQKIEAIEYEEFGKLLDYEALEDFRSNALNPERPMLRSTVQNPDIYFQVREANNSFYDAIPGIVEDYMKKISSITGRDYKLFKYHGDPEAENIVVAMGSVSPTICETIDYLNANGEKLGFLQVFLYRPFATEKFLEAIPKSVKKIAVLDRCKEMGSAGEPLFQDVCTAFTNTGRQVEIIGGRYGLSSKDTDPAQIRAVYENLKLKNSKTNFTVGINDDVTNLSLQVGEPLYPTGDDTICCKFWGLGSDGTVGANKDTVKIISDNTDNYAQAYFEYDAKKSFGITKSHLRFSSKPILSTYYVKMADFVAVHKQTYMEKYDILSEIKDNGTLLINCDWKPEQLDKVLTADVKRKIVEKNINLYIIDADGIAVKNGMPGRFNLVLQSAFFKLVPIIPIEESVLLMKEAARKTYFSKGEDVVNKNLMSIDAGIEALVKIEIPDSWKDAVDLEKAEDENIPAVIKNILEPLNAGKGDDLPVSAFKNYEDGSIELGLTAYEKRANSQYVPLWDAEKCVQCNMCSYVCPHGVIRPYLLSGEEVNAAPEGFVLANAKGKDVDEYKYSLQISARDCTGCKGCINACPSDALKMVHIDESVSESNWEYGLKITEKNDVYNKYSIKGSQFKQPLIEFSAACAGCGETPYAKIITQLFGDRAYWANATGCSQAWGAAMPGIPYTKNKEGRGPAWSNSLFENNAEFSLGMMLSVRHQRESEKKRVESLLVEDINDNLKSTLKSWIDSYDDFELSDSTGKTLIAELNEEVLSGKAQEIKNEILKNKEHLSKKTFWMFGGDGWAYDIGYGGLDHVVATGEDLNVFIIDTEVYSNTGGQSSKSTPIGAVAGFAAAGKKSSKKNLGELMMTYENVYVAQVAMGADPNHLIKVLKEAQEYKGPSVIVAYTPCIAHGIKKGMDKTQEEMKDAVKSGYWHLYRYNPDKDKPFTLDSKEPTIEFEDFLRGEVRYESLYRTFPDNAKELFQKGKEISIRKYKKYKEMEKNQ